MRTTLTLDDDIAERLQAESQRTGRAFKEIVNEHLRSSLARSLTVTSMEPFQVTACDLGGPVAAGSYDNIAALLDDSDGTGHP